MMTVPEFLTRYPEFTDTSVPLIEVAISDAIPFFDTCRWGDYLAQGYAALVAHTLSIGKMESASSGLGTVEGQVQSKQVDGVAVSFMGQGAYKVIDSDLAKTSYGMKYMRLRRLVGIGCVAI